MNLLICLFGPSVLAVKLFDSLKSGLSNRNMLLYYGIFVFVLNIIASLLSYLLFGIDGNINDEILNSNVFALKYCFLSSILILIIVPLFDIIGKNVSVCFEVVTNEKGK